MRRSKRMIGKRLLSGVSRRHAAKLSRPGRLVSAGTLGTVGFGSVFLGTVYFVPLFKETRSGLYLAWNYPYDLVYRGSASELMWKGVVGLTGLVASFKAVKAITVSSNVFSSVAQTGVSAFAGILTAMFCMEQSNLIVGAALRSSKFISYSIDGLVADTIGRPPGQLPVWERRDHITVESVQRLHEKNASKKRKNADGSGVSPVEMLLARVETTVDVRALEEILQEAAGLENEESRTIVQKAALAKHQKQLVVRMSQLRAEEAVMRTRDVLASTSKESFLEKRSIDSVKQDLARIEEEKKSIKAKSLAIHGEKLTHIWGKQLDLAVNQLSDLRVLQYNLATKLHDLGSGDTLIIKQQLREMDEAKAVLKRESREVFGVNISGRAQSVTPWRMLAQ